MQKTVSELGANREALRVDDRPWPRLPDGVTEFSGASSAPQCAKPHRRAMSAAVHANGYAPNRPARRIVEFDALCT
jgi:hypothetical protein